MCLLPQVEALLERVDNGKPPVQDVVDALEALGYSWAQRLVASASECLAWREGGRAAAGCCGLLLQ